MQTSWYCWALCIAMIPSPKEAACLTWSSGSMEYFNMGWTSHWEYTQEFGPQNSMTSSRMQRPHWRSVLGLSGGKGFTTCCTILLKACKKLVDLTKDEEALPGFEPGTGHAAVACSTNWAIRSHLATFLQLLYRNLRLFSSHFSQSDAWNANRTSNPWFLKWLSIGAEPCFRADNRIWKAYFL